MRDRPTGRSPDSRAAPDLRGPTSRRVGGIVEDMTLPGPADARSKDSSTPAYTSSLSISFGDPPKDTAPWLTATSTDRNDSALRDLRRRVIDPVVAGLLAADELEQTTVYRSAGSQEIRVWITAGGEDFHELLARPAYSLSAEPAAVAEHLADRLEDWVCETRFGWGQQRKARYVLPPE